MKGRLPVKSLLYPSVALMNRLSFGQKFSLISVLFFLPMLVTNFYLVRDSWHEFVGTRTEQSSLELLRGSLALRDLETLADLVEINAVLGQSEPVPELQKRIEALEATVLADLQRLTPMAESEEQITAFNARRDELIAGFKAQQAESGLLNKSALVEKLLNKAQTFSKVIASQAGLNHDDSSDIRQLTELMTSVTPLVAQAIGDGRAMGSYSLGQGLLNSATSTRLSKPCPREYK